MRELETTLLLIRHPHTAANDGGGARMSGWTDTPLSARGRSEARELRDRLVGDAVTFEAIYTSPLQRTRLTGALLSAAHLGPLRVARDLAEIGCGALDGCEVEEVRRRHPDLWERNERQDDPRFRWPGGESYLEFRARCVGALTRIATMHRGGRAAVVTHAGVVAQLLGWIAGESPARWGLFRPGNASLTSVRFGARGATVVTFDDRRHLAPRR